MVKQKKKQARKLAKSSDLNAEQQGRKKTYAKKNTKYKKPQ